MELAQPGPRRIPCLREGRNSISNNGRGKPIVRKLAQEGFRSSAWRMLSGHDTKTVRKTPPILQLSAAPDSNAQFLSLSFSKWPARHLHRKTKGDDRERISAALASLGEDWISPGGTSTPRTTSRPPAWQCVAEHGCGYSLDGQPPSPARGARSQTAARRHAKCPAFLNLMKIRHATGLS